MKPALPLRLLSAGLLLTAGLLWLVWPWLRPRLWPAAGATWLVVLDGYHRLDAALEPGLTESQDHGSWRGPAGAGCMGTALAPWLRFRTVLI